ncbi:hypothetical protein [Streptosporangium longisporum]|uniref:FxLD family lantipeptide n=1 Tax=Streptosporangium longisporum TaxID=46187 RepID=A0ABN3YAD5_9ACTN
MTTRSDEDTPATGGPVTDPAQQTAAVTSGCCGDPVSGPVEPDLTELDLDDTASGCCGG